MDAVATMGTILDDETGGRDAVHVAVISVIAGESLQPGWHVGFLEQPTGTSEGKVGNVDSSSPTPVIGIVDPFLEEAVAVGERFWLYLYPRTITSLRHQWTHPAFPDAVHGSVYHTPTQKLEAEQWLKEFVKAGDCPSYDYMIKVLNAIADGKTKEWTDLDTEGYYGWQVDDKYLHFGGSDAHGEIPAEFWDMAEIVIGKPIKTKPSYFSCSC